MPFGRIRMAMAAIGARQAQTRRRRLLDEEQELRALMVTIHAAAGNEAGVNAAYKFRLVSDGPDAEPEPVRTSNAKVVGMFGAPAWSDEEAARLRGEGGAD